MKATRGRSDGKTLELDEQINLDRQVEVIVLFPDLTDDREMAAPPQGRFIPGLVAPSGLPPFPTPEEWKQRMDEVVQMLGEWESEGGSDDLATWDELKAGLEANPFTLREIELDD